MANASVVSSSEAQGRVVKRLRTKRFNERRIKRSVGLGVGQTW